MDFSHTIRHRRLNRCDGWGCLTRPEKIGIIFSIVVVSIVLLLAYMYCLGRARLAHRHRMTIRLPGGRQTERGHDHGTTMAYLPVAHHAPGHPPQVVYQPAVFHLTSRDSETAQTYVASPTAVPQPSATIPPVIMYIAPPALGATGPQFGQVSEPVRAEPSGTTPQRQRRNSSAESLRQPRSPTWFQRLSRVLRMPVGRASTIASPSAPGTPVRATSSEARRHTPHPDTGERHEGDANRETPSPTVDQRRNSPSVPDVDTNSVESNAATVHTDDFEMLDPPSSLVREHGTSHAHASGSAQADLMPTEEGGYSPYPAGLYASHWIPSESSLQPVGESSRNGKEDCKDSIRRPDREALRHAALDATD